MTQSIHTHHPNILDFHPLSPHQLLYLTRYQFLCHSPDSSSIPHTPESSSSINQQFIQVNQHYYVTSESGLKIYSIVQAPKFLREIPFPTPLMHIKSIPEQSNILFLCGMERMYIFHVEHEETLYEVDVMGLLDNGRRRHADTNATPTTDVVNPTREQNTGTQHKTLPDHFTCMDLEVSERDNAVHVALGTGEGRMICVKFPLDTLTQSNATVHALRSALSTQVDIEMIINEANAQKTKSPVTALSMCGGWIACGTNLGYGAVFRRGMDDPVSCFVSNFPITSLVFVPSTKELVCVGYHKEILVFQLSGELLRRIPCAGLESIYKVKLLPKEDMCTVSGHGRVIEQHSLHGNSKPSIVQVD